MKKISFILAAFLLQVSLNNLQAQELLSVQTYTFDEVDQPPLPEICPAEPRDVAESCFKKALRAHIAKHFQYPEEALRRELQGKVYVDFKINTRGKVSDIKTTGADPILQEEARRILTLLPDMKPGRHEGAPVSVRLRVPIPFQLVME